MPFTLALDDRYVGHGLELIGVSLMNRLLAFLTLALFSAASIASDDTLAKRQEAAARITEASMGDSMLRDIAESMAMNLQPEERPWFMELMTSQVDFTSINEALEEKLVERLSMEELTVLAEFYEQPVATAALKKVAISTAEIVPMINAEVMRAVGQFQLQQAERNRLKPNLDDTDQ